MDNREVTGPRAAWRWTPGPWRVARNYGPIFDVMGEDNGKSVGVCRVFTDSNQHGRPLIPEAEANARLIALAPELAEFVERMACVGEDLIQPEKFVLEARALLSRLGVKP